MDERIVKINDNTWRIEDGFVRCFLLCGTEKALLIDSAASGFDVKALAQSITDLPLMLLNTHADGDHMAGNGSFDCFYMHPADYEKCNVAEKFPDAKLLPLSDGDILDLGNRPLEIIAIPGHTYGSVAILDRNARFLISGDSVQNGHIYMFGAHRDKASFASSMEKLMALSNHFDTVFPSHGDAELPAKQVEIVLSAWKSVLSGDVTPQPQELHGKTIQCYDAEGCGFYCG